MAVTGVDIAYRFLRIRKIRFTKFGETDNQEGNRPVIQDGGKMFDLMFVNGLEWEGSLLCAFLRLKVDILPPINPVIVSGGGELEIGLGDFGGAAPWIIYLDDGNGSRLFVYHCPVNRQVILVGRIDIFF